MRLDPELQKIIDQAAGEGRIIEYGRRAMPPDELATPPRPPAHTPGEMNKTERAYSQVLEAREGLTAADLEEKILSLRRGEQ